MNEEYILYVKKDCSYCVSAVALLEHEQKPYKIVALGDDKKLLNEIKAALSWPTFPVIYARHLRDEDGTLKLIGGYTDLCKHFGFADE